MSSASDISILIQLIQLAQKKGAYSLEESYLAFSVISKYVKDEKYTQIINLVKTLEDKVNILDKQMTETDTLENSNKLLINND